MTSLSDLQAQLGGRYAIERELGRGGTGTSPKPAVRAPDRIDALEMRVAELERWRKEN